MKRKLNFSAFLLLTSCMSSFTPPSFAGNGVARHGNQDAGFIQSPQFAGQTAVFDASGILGGNADSNGVQTMSSLTGTQYHTFIMLDTSHIRLLSTQTIHNGINTQLLIGSQGHSQTQRISGSISDSVGGSAFYATLDSAEMISSNNNNTSDGLVGCKRLSAYLDVVYRNETMLNSFTVDTDWIHWQYQGVERYTLPLKDGKDAGDVMTTDHNGGLYFSVNTPSIDSATLYGMSFPPTGQTLFCRDCTGNAPNFLTGGLVTYTGMLWRRNF